MSSVAYFAATIALGAISTVVVLTRLWLLRKKERDIAGFASEFIYCLSLPVGLVSIGLVCNVLFKQIKWRTEMENVGLEEFVRTEEQRKLLYIAEVTYRFQLWLLKFAYIFFFWGIFARVRSRYRWVVYSVFLLTVTTAFAVIAILFTGCEPIHKHWALSPTKDCWADDIDLSLRLVASSDIFTMGLIILTGIVLLKTITGVKYTSLEKQGLALIFIIASLAPIFAGIRYHFLSFLSPPSIFAPEAHLPTLLQTLETTLTYLPLFILSFRPDVDNPPEVDWSATLVIPSVVQPGLQRRSRRTLTLGLGAGKVEFQQRTIDLEGQEDAVPGVDYKIYETATGTTKPVHSPAHSPTGSLHKPPVIHVGKHEVYGPRTTVTVSPLTIQPIDNTPSRPMSTPSPVSRERNISRAGSHRSQFEKIRHRIEEEGFRDFTAGEARLERLTEPMIFPTKLSPRPRSPPGSRRN